MRTFALAPENARLLAGLDAFQTSGSLPSPGTRPADLENGALYDEIVRGIAVINGQMEVWRSQALYEGQSVYQAQQNMSTP